MASANICLGPECTHLVGDDVFCAKCDMNHEIGHLDPFQTWDTVFDTLDYSASEVRLINLGNTTLRSNPKRWQWSFQ